MSVILSSLAGILLFYSQDKAGTTNLVNTELIAIAIAVIGGTSLSGGYVNSVSILYSTFFYVLLEMVVNIWMNEPVFGVNISSLFKSGH